MSELTKVNDITTGRFPALRRATDFSEKPFSIVRLLSRQHKVLTTHNAGNISGEYKVGQLISYGFVTETAEGRLELTNTAIAFLKNEVAYPIEAILEAQDITNTELYCSTHLKEVLRSFGISEDYLIWWQKLCRHSGVPGMPASFQKPHLEIPIVGVSEQDCLNRLSQVQGYFFGVSLRKTATGQFTLIIVSAS